MNKLITLITQNHWISFWDMDGEVRVHDMLGEYESLHRKITIPDNIKFFVNSVSFLYTKNGIQYGDDCWTYKFKTIEELQEKLKEIYVLFLVCKCKTGEYVIRGLPEDKLKSNNI